MIEFTADQEKRAMRRDCRIWTEFMVEAWYMSDHPHATEYRAADLVSDLRKVYFACRENDIENVQHISLLGFKVLYANMLGCSQEDITAIVQYFCGNARAGNADFATNWIETYLEEVD
ncbi:hypothetical protein [Massilia pseudoviolaceinigra]|uniref:hypothetical protein n=1 Tax=Massilia pseudoviolaceinigra TaxID=3057165 RepID=UPI00279651C1|nr:hypothetical protein [Massilia sp. CCM 9206]MDQ1924210.1 hypothetical protein [Massilia sp. CCM 9206]